MYKWGYALEKLQFTNLDLQICNCKVAMLACSGYKVPTLHLQNTKLHSSNFGLQVWNDITHMYIYGTTNHKYWFTNLQLHGCNVRILTPLAFHISVPNKLNHSRRFNISEKIWRRRERSLFSFSILWLGCKYRANQKFEAKTIRICANCT